MNNGRLALVLGLGLAVSACGASPLPGASSAAPSGQATAVVRLGTNPISPTNGFVWVGRDLGAFAQAGAVVQVQGLGGAQRMNSLVAGEIDGEAGAGPQEVVAAKAQGTDLTIVGAFSNKFDDVLLVTNDITSVQQLRGRSIGSVTTTSVDVQGLTMYLRKFGFEPDRDYKVVGVGASASQAGPAAAILAHQVDAVMVQEDFARGVVTQGGFHVLADLYDTDIRQPGAPIDFRTEFVKEHPDLVQKTLDGLILSVRYANEHPSETQALWAKHYKIDDQDHVRAIYQREIALWQKAPVPDANALVDVIDFVARTNPRARSLTAAELIDTRFVDSAIQRGLTSY